MHWCSGVRYARANLLRQKGGIFIDLYRVKTNKMTLIGTNNYFEQGREGYE